MAGILYAIPTPLGAQDALPASAVEIVRSLRSFAVENEKTARAFLKAVGMPVAIQELDVFAIDVATSIKKLGTENLGLLSEAGCPAIADPGASLVEAAHREGIRVVPLIGPSSIVLALMASGLEGQRFAFYGYLPKDKGGREKKIRELEQRSRREHETQIFIEAPYRNDALMASLLATCSATTQVCVATDLTLESERIETRNVDQWKPGPIGKRPTVFLLLAH